MESWVNDVEYLILPSRHPVKGYEKQYHQAYRMWREGWEKFRREIGVTQPLNSDGFVLPDEIGIVFYQGEPVGMTAFTYGDLAQGPMADLSWFNAWTDIACQKLKNISSNAMICSQLTVSPKFTGRDQVVRWKQIVFLYSFMRFEASVADVMAGHINLTRKVDDACGKGFGATMLDPHKVFDYYGVEIPSQLVAYQKPDVLELRKKHGLELSDALWERKLHLTDWPIINRPLPLRKAA